MRTREYDNSAVISRIKERIHNERNRKIMYARYINGYTYERIAETFGLSVSQTKRIIYKAEKAVFFEN